MVEYYLRSFKRLLWIAGEQYDNVIDKAFMEFLAAYEVFLKEEKPSSPSKATYIRKAVANKGITKTIEDMVKNPAPSTGFIRLMAYNMPESTLEHVVVENSHQFSDDIVESALEKLVAHV